jgi:leader peptidase (prepilin peptidase) / N-methyltransferase
MYILIFIIGLIIGIILNRVIESISYSITKSKRKTMNIYIPIICALSFEVLFLRLGFTIILSKAIAMTAILIIISFIDLRHRIIPNFMVVITLVIGIIFSFIVGASFIDTIFGMISGGGILFLLALVPNAMGGGDIKLMFAIGAFLGLNRTLWALLLAFIMSSIISIALILFKIKGTKDYIPFGPFLALGSFISLLIFK